LATKVIAAVLERLSPLLYGVSPTLTNLYASEGFDL
jgi:hypothetical protein